MYLQIDKNPQPIYFAYFYMLVVICMYVTFVNYACN